MPVGGKGVGGNSVGENTVGGPGLGRPSVVTKVRVVISPTGSAIGNHDPISIVPIDPAGATMYYTIDGSTPDTGSTLYTGPFTLSADATVKAFGVYTGYTDADVVSETFTVTTDQLTAPTITPTSASITDADTLTITAPLGDIEYQIDSGGYGAYSAPFTLSVGTRDVDARAVLATYTTSDVTSESYTVSYSQTAAAPVISPGAGEILNTTDITITAPGTIYYTTDGSTPDTGDTVYSAAFNLAADATVKAYAVEAGKNDSSVSSKVYTIAVSEAPEISPPAGAITTSTDITIVLKDSEGATASGTIYYTTDGSTPDTGSTVYSTPINLGADATVKAVGVEDGHLIGAVTSVAYTVTGAAIYDNDLHGSYGLTVGTNNVVSSRSGDVWHEQPGLLSIKIAGPRFKNARAVVNEISTTHDTFTAGSVTASNNSTWILSGTVDGTISVTGVGSGSLVGTGSRVDLVIDVTTGGTLTATVTSGTATNVQLENVSGYSDAQTRGASEYQSDAIGESFYDY